MKTLLVFGAMALLMASCASSVDATTCVDVETAGGFWWGLWNGITVGWSFLGSLFSSDISIYDVNNTGRWYDFGFVLGTGNLIVAVRAILKILSGE
ncbi:MAG: hypothetical protein GY827_04905 [Cytophagales bacterium]|nr:hypothetical protein [Cytophagales bacterium]